MSKETNVTPVLKATKVKETAESNKSSSDKHVYTNVKPVQRTPTKTYTQQRLPQLGLVNEGSPLIMIGALLLGIVVLSCFIQNLRVKLKQKRM